MIQYKQPAWTFNETREFLDKQSNISIKKRGLPVGDYLIVSSYASDKFKFQIYNIKSGKPVIKTVFTNAHEAKELAEWMNSTWGEFFPLWEEYPEADIFALAKWSVKNGLNLFKLMQKLKEVTLLSTKETVSA